MRIESRLKLGVGEMSMLGESLFAATKIVA